MPRPEPPRYDGHYGPEFRFNSAIALNDKMLWCFAWDNTEASIEPSFLVYAYEVGLEKGKLKLLRRTELTKFGGMSTGLRKISGNSALFGSVGKVAQLDLRTWKVVNTWDGNLIPAASGRTYMQSEKGDVFEWNKVGKWEAKSGPIPLIHRVVTMGGNDIFLSQESLENLDTKKRYSIPSASGNYFRQYSVIADPKIGLGVSWSYPTREAKDGVGAILNPNTLARTFAITKKSVKKKG